MTKLIGITGYAQHGKNTAAETVKNYFPEGKVAIIGFADALRDMAKVIGEFVVIDDVDLTYAEALRTMGYERTKTVYPKARSFLQKLGTEAVRNNLGEDAWINALDNRARNSGASLVVVPDTRFENETKYILEHGELWAVHRPGFDNGLGKDHPSESYIVKAQGYADVHFHADNVESLVKSVKQYLADGWEKVQPLEYSDELTPF